MSTPINSWQSSVPNGHPVGRVIEIIGPAGAGKSTLYRALAEFDLCFIQEPLPPVWNIDYLPFFIKNFIALLPVLFHLYTKGGRRPTRQELAWMAMLNGWPELLNQKTKDSRKIILLDQGPIFLMATLLEFGPPGLQNEEIWGWWKKIYARWMKVLDLIVWLDANDDLLTRRIRTREQDHDVKEASDQQVRAFLAQWRKVYDQVMKAMSLDNPNLRIAVIDTEKNSVDEIVARVISEIDKH
jgi:shikimate kinase